MNTDETTPIEQILIQQLKQFSGSQEYTRHALNRSVVYTEGVSFLAEHAQAYWLIDAIASYFGTATMKRAIRNDYRLESLQFWKLQVKSDQSAVLTARADKGEKPFIKQEIDYSDFPLDAIEIWAGFDGRFWTLYLPSEH